MGNAQKKDFKVGNIAVVGARGYSGIELARLLLNHPAASLTHCFATQKDWKLSDFLSFSDFENAQKVVTPEMSELTEIASSLNTVFLATPAEVSMNLAPSLLAQGINVIDLSGAFRLPVETFEKFYGYKHSCAELLEKAQFGLIPFAGPFSSPAKIKESSQLIANPGCYATSVFMAILPLLQKGAIQPDTLVIDAKSGTSGAGKKAAENLLFTEVDSECLPYKVGKHQHLPEICHHAKELTGESIDPMFTTHLLPVSRGITSGIYARLSPSFGKGPDAQAKIDCLYKEAFEGYPLVATGPCSPALMSLKRVVGTPMTQISFTVEGNKLYVFSVLDNLMKGAASQAVENFNRLLDLPLATGLLRSSGAITKGTL